MTEARFALSWDSYGSTVCNGLSTFQQNGEFVDMTLAADGHFVKVHQVVVSLVSPYIRELIKTAQCQHPVIFLNDITYTTLCSILEYIYTGEAIVTPDNLPDIVHAGKALHIKGLENMSKLHLLQSSEAVTGSKYRESYMKKPDKPDNNKNNTEESIDNNDTSENQVILIDNFHEDYEDTDNYISVKKESTVCKKRVEGYTFMKERVSENPTIQYTISNQGSLQMILNRYIYYLRYCSKKTKSGQRLWRCVNYIRSRCPASVVTKDNIVIQRSSAHTHPFHDKQIAKKVKQGAIFSAVTEAENEGENLRKNKVGAAEMS